MIQGFEFCVGISSAACVACNRLFGTSESVGYSGFSDSLQLGSGGSISLQRQF